MRSKSPSRAVNVYVPLWEPEIRGNEWRYVKECLDTNWVSSAGPFVERFERDIAAYLGVKHAVATVNGTSALHVALLAAGVQPGDEVLVSTLTFIAPANAVRYAGAWPVFMDAEPAYWQMDPEKVLDFVEKGCQWRDRRLINKTTGRPVKAILAVHILGHPCDMTPILDVATRHGLTVIEDAAESLGARYRGRMAGTLGDIACLSFNGNKLITAGGGGMVVTNRDDWAQRARYLTTQAKDDPGEYVHAEIGYNYRLTNLQAALGCAQLEQIDEFIGAKRRTASLYAEALAPLGEAVTPMAEAPWAKATFWLSTILVHAERFGMDSRGLGRELRREGIETRPLWQPLHRSRAHAGAQAWRCAVADRLYQEALSLPSSVGITEDQVLRVTEAIR